MFPYLCDVKQQNRISITSKTNKQKTDSTKKRRGSLWHGCRPSKGNATFFNLMKLCVFLFVLNDIT